MRLLRIVFGLMLLGSLPACGSTETRVAVSNVLHHLNLNLYDSYDLLPLMRSPQSGLFPFNEVKWNSSGTEVIYLHADSGRITAKKPGFCVITAELPDRTIQFSITVSQTPSVTAKRVQVRPEVLSLSAGESVELRATVYLSNNEINSDVNWYCSDTTIASINPTTGVIKALRNGLTTVVAFYPSNPDVRSVMVLKVFPCPDAADDCYGKE